MKKLMNRVGLLAAAFGLALAVALALNAAAQTPAGATASAIGSDEDYDGLIEITTAAQLNVMRYDLDGDGAPDAGTAAADQTTYNNLFVCPPTTAECFGYELMANISLAEYKGWESIGAWQAVFDGNGFSVTGLEGANGLFSYIGTGYPDVDRKTIVKNVYVVGAKITRSVADLGPVGVLASRNHGTIIGSYASGDLISESTGGATGGLVGLNKGTIAGSVADVDVTVKKGNPHMRIGGFVGVNNANIYGSYAYGDITDASPAGNLNARGFSVNNINKGGMIYSSVSYGDKIVTNGNGDKSPADFSSIRPAARGRFTPNSCALSDESKFTCPTPTPTPTN